MPTIAHDSLLAFAAEILQAVGSRPEDAQRVAKQLVEGNLTGHDSHGVVRLPQYCEHARDGRVNLQGKPRIVQQSETTALVDGDLAWGPLVFDFATQCAEQFAELRGLGAVSVRRAHHVGRLGTYPAVVAQRGFLGIAFCDVQGVSRVAPWGGREPRLGTNPLAIAIPAPQEPIVVDFATSAVAEGKVRLAKLAGAPVPLGWVVGADGQFSRDPNDAYHDGALAPLGVDQGHKGYALSVAIDLLAGVLSGAGFASQADHYGNALLLVVIDPAMFGSNEHFLQRVAAYVRYVKSAAGDGEADVWLPGEKESRLRRSRIADGIPVGDEVWRELTDLAANLGVSTPPDVV